ncbi:MAG: hypothetical protein KDJ38_10950 [Gammaproteobacteria bacterium]|nr:hypothetical protein [Gammaproteobacteria bacterium]
MSALLRKTFRITVTAILLALLAVQPVLADKGGKISRQDAIREAQKRNGGGKVLSVAEHNKNGNRSFEVKLISDGKVRVFTIHDR